MLERLQKASANLDQAWAGVRAASLEAVTEAVAVHDEWVRRVLRGEEVTKEEQNNLSSMVYYLLRGTDSLDEDEFRPLLEIQRTFHEGFLIEAHDEWAFRLGPWPNRWVNLDLAKRTCRAFDNATKDRCLAQAKEVAQEASSWVNAYERLAFRAAVWGLKDTFLAVNEEEAWPTPATAALTELQQGITEVLAKRGEG